MLESDVSVFLTRVLNGIFLSLPQAIVAGSLIIAEDSGCRCMLVDPQGSLLEDSLCKHDVEEATWNM